MIITKIQGGLGNQLFQYAAALNISQTLNQPILIDTSIYNEGKFLGLFRLDKFKIDYVETKEAFPILKNQNISNRVKNYLFRNTSFFPYFGHNVINGDDLKYPLKSLSKLTKNKFYILEGWFQRNIYYSINRKLLYNQFWLKENNVIDNKLLKKINLNNSVAVHVRRGDMAINPNFAAIEKDYYLKAFDKILSLTENPSFIVFSDEPSKAKDLFQDVKLPLYYVKKQSQALGAYSTKGDYIDFELMRLCNHFIIANSTFSWWPAYLSKNKNKIVVAPKNWFKNTFLQSNFEKSGLLQNDWISI